MNEIPGLIAIIWIVLCGLGTAGFFWMLCVDTEGAPPASKNPLSRYTLLVVFAWPVLLALFGAVYIAASVTALRDVTAAKKASRQ